MSLSIDTINSTLQQANYLFAQTLHDEFITLEYNSNSDYESKSKFNTDELFNITESLQYRVDRSLIDEVSIDLYKRLQRFIGSNNVDVSFSATYDPPSGTIIVPNSSFSTFLSLLDTPNSYTGQSNKVVSVKTDETGLEFTFPSTGVISDATNGLHIDGTLAKLGGSLIENTTINLNSNTLKFNSKWIEYVNDFSSTSSSNSRAIPDVGWVTSQINANDIFFRTNSLLGTGTSIDPYAPNATNGLSVSNGFGIQLGGSLLGNTNIITTGYGLSLTSNSSTAVPFTIKGTIGSTPSISLESTDTVDGRNTIRFASTRTSSQIWEFGQNPAGTNNIFGLRNVSSTTLPTVDIVWATDSTSNTTTFNFPLILAASTSAASGLTLLAGATDTSSTDGSIWYDGIHLFGYLNGGVVQIDGGGSGGSWGTITGTLSSQTDLQSALDSKQTTLTFNNGGIVNNSGNIEIGGTIIGGRSLNLNSYAFEMFDNTSSNESDYTQYQGSIILTGGKVSTFNFGKVQVSSVTANLGYSANISGVQKINQIELNGMFINDQINSKGFVYGGNYRSNFTSFSLIDKGYADATYATISGSGFITSISIASSNGFIGTSSGGTTPALTLTLQNATTSQAGKLTSTDWNTFNNKQAAGNYVTSISLTTPNILYTTPINWTITSGAASATLALTIQTANTILAGPVSGSAATPTFRQIAIADHSATGTPSSSTYYRGDNTWASVSAIPGGATTQIQYNSSGAFSGNANLIFDGSTNSTYIGTPGTALTPTTGTINFIGCSITVGTGTTFNTGLPIQGIRYSTQIANALGLTENNLGLSGAQVQNAAGGTPYSTIATSLPSYSGTGLVIIEVGPNDCARYTGVGGTYQPSVFQTDLTSLITYIASTKGWPVAKILIIGNAYMRLDIYTGSVTTTVHNTYIAAALAVATAKGTMYYDVNNQFVNNGGDALMFDLLHPNNSGHTYESRGVLSVLQTAATYVNGQTLGVNGLIEASTLKLNNPILLLGNTNSVLGADASGNVQRLSSLPNNILFSGNTVLTGGIYSTGVTYSLTPNQHDWLLGEQVIYSQNTANTAWYTSTNLCDHSTVGYTFKTSFNSSGTNLFQWYNGAGINVFSMLQSGVINATNNILIPYGNAGLITAGAGGATQCGFIPFINGTWIQNDFSAGWIGFRTSLGVSGGSLTEAGRFSAMGNYLLGTTTDNGIKLDINGTSRAISSFGVGMVAQPAFPTFVTSTTGGTLAAGNHYATLVAIDQNGNQTNQSVENVCTTTGSTSSVTWSWVLITGAASYRLYVGTTAGGENNYLAASGSTTSIVDIGSGYTSATPPTQNKTRLANISSTGAALFTSATIVTSPITSASTYDLLTRNTSTGVVEKVASSNLSWIVASADLLAQTAAVASIATTTVGASTGTFRIGGYVNITAVTLDVIQFQCTFTDENNASQTLVFYPMGATAAGLSTTGFNALSDATIRCKNGTAITIKTVLTTGTGSITYDVGCQIQQLR